ncbi:sorbosone dehydrogenase family protein, partial [Raoultella planticola]
MYKHFLIVPLAFALAAVLSGCDEKAKLTPDQQIGPDPLLPKAQDFLVPPMQVPSGVGWKSGMAPKVAAGLKIENIASGLMHPRQVYVLPNDDVLVVESNSPGSEPLTTPKQLIAGIVKNQSGKGGKGGNSITLLRKGPDGWQKHLFLQHLHSPFGVQLIGDNLYVANTDSIMRFPYRTGETSISAPGTELADLPDKINHHWTKALLASP